MERWNPTPQEIAEIRERVYLLSTKRPETLSGEDRRTLSDVPVLLLRLYERVTSERGEVPGTGDEVTALIAIEAAKRAINDAQNALANDLGLPTGSNVDEGDGRPAFLALASAYSECCDALALLLTQRNDALALLLTQTNGHAVLRKLLPDAGPRRAFMATACGREVWDAADLICAVNDANRRKKPVNVTPEEAALVRAFVESI